MLAGCCTLRKWYNEKLAVGFYAGYQLDSQNWQHHAPTLWSLNSEHYKFAVPRSPELQNLSEQ
jgi:hypothetical protein